MTTETALAHSEATLDADFLRSMFQGAAVALVACAADGTVVAANSAAERLFALPHGITPGIPVSGIFPSSERQRVDAALIQCTELRVPVDLDLQLGADNSLKKIAAFLTPVINRDARLKGVAFSFREISSRLEQQRQAAKQQRLTSLGALAGSVSHHYNNLLTCIATTIDYAKNMSTLAAMKKTLERSNEPLQRASQMTQQLLAFAQADHRHRDIADLTECVLLYCDEHEAALRAKHVELRLERASIPVLSVPRESIRVILNNLVDNALDAMKSGGVLTIELKQPDPSHVLLAVSDTGTGIDPTMLDRLFEPFQTTKGELAVCGPGQHRNPGLGLAVVHGLVRAMNSTITASNRPQGGARFEILLPISTANRSDSAAD